MYKIFEILFNHGGKCVGNPVPDLLDHVSEINARNIHGDTPLGYAMMRLSCKCVPDYIVPWLLENGADPAIMNTDGKPAIYSLLYNKQYSEIIQVFKKYGVDPNIRDLHDGTLLTIACNMMNYGGGVIIHDLLDFGVDPSLRTLEGDTALVNAVINGLADVEILTLIDHGAKIPDKDNLPSSFLRSLISGPYDESFLFHLITKTDFKRIKISVLKTLLKYNIKKFRSLERVLKYINISASKNPQKYMIAAIRYRNIDAAETLCRHGFKMSTFVSDASPMITYFYRGGNPWFSESGVLLKFVERWPCLVHYNSCYDDLKNYFSHASSRSMSISADVMKVFLASGMVLDDDWNEYHWDKTTRSLKYYSQRVARGLSNVPDALNRPNSYDKEVGSLQLRSDEHESLLS